MTNDLENQQAIEPYFDREYYLAHNPDVVESGQDPLIHFYLYGWREGRDPSATFSTVYYSGANPDVADADINPLLHYAQRGHLENRATHPKNRELEDQQAIEPYFDREYYLAHNPDVVESGQDPLIHFYLYGWREGRDPSATFSTVYYSKANPDVADADINPLLHYAQRGHLENRATHPKNRELEDQQAIEPYFDREYYLAHNPDVVESGQDPLIHFYLYGWREGRDPSATFSTNYYLDTNTDVADADINPLIHYARLGEVEGRLTAKPAFNPGEREILEQFFDKEFYLNNNPDLIDAYHDALEHFHLYGWREGRDPNQNFSTKYYLETNWDIVHADINPLLHYGLTGRREGRTPKRKLHEKRTILEKAKDARSYYIKRQFKIGEQRISADHIVQLTRRHKDSHLMFSFSHDDYGENFGGVQNIIRREVNKTIELNGAYFHISPVDYSRALHEEHQAMHAFLRCRYNGVYLGYLTMADLIEAANNMKVLSIESTTVVHHMMGFAPELIATFARQNSNRVYAWAHDYFDACEKYTLLRNDLIFCAAPKIDSGSCRICVYGEGRSAHVSRIKAFFSELKPVVIAPSRFALESWAKFTECEFSYGVINEPVKFKFHDTQLAANRNTVKKDGTTVLRVAYLGARVTHKGWDTFRALAEKNDGNNCIEFYHIGDDHGDFISEKTVQFIPVKVAESNPNAMIDAVVAHKIDVVINCPKWPETFNFVTYEAIAGGAFVITTKSSGNVSEFLKTEAPDQSYVAADDEEVFSIFQKKEVFEIVNTAVRRTGELRATFGTIDFLETRTLN
ncbi:hypothetical protein ACLBXB_21650 [Methylobacterium mesophilicum]